MSRIPFRWFVDLMKSQVGQVEPMDPKADNLPAEAFEVKEETNEAEAGKEGEQVAQEAEEQEEVSEDEIPEELRPKEGLDPALEKHRAGMHRGYTKALEKLKAREAELDEEDSQREIVHKFFNDKNYAASVVQDWASQNGYSLTRAQAAAVAQNQSSQLAPGYVELVKSQLPEELHSFAPSIAQATYAVTKQLVNPILQQQEQTRQTQEQASQQERTEAVNTLMEELEVESPGWQEHEDEMIELLDYLENPKALTHKAFGSKAKLLLNLVTGGAKATNDAAERMRAAARHKGVKPQGSRGPNTTAERIQQAKTDDEVWDIAVSDALTNYKGPMPD